MTSLVAVTLDGVAAECLERALTREEEVCELFGRVFPPALAELRALAVQAASSGHPWTPAATNGAGRDDALMREWLTTAETAEVLGVSERTVRRRIADGSLPATLFGPRCRRVHRDALRGA